MLHTSLSNRITRASAGKCQPTGLVGRISSYWRRGRFIPTLAIMVVVSMSILSLGGCTASNYSTSWVTSTSTLCQSCHDTGEVAYMAEEKIVSEEKQCVLPVKEMRDSHKELLNDWKDAVVREGDSIYVASDGKQYKISLTGTCLDCHSNKAEFCDQCHSYMGVIPSCWNCHEVPEGD